MPRKVNKNTAFRDFSFCRRHPYKNPENTTKSTVCLQKTYIQGKETKMKKIILRNSFHQTEVRVLKIAQGRGELWDITFFRLIYHFAIDG